MLSYVYGLPELSVCEIRWKKMQTETVSGFGSDDDSNARYIVKFEIRDAWHRHKLDRIYLNRMRPKMIGCPKCGSIDGLNYSIDATCNVRIDCKYRIKCDRCGYVQPGWYENIADAVLIFDIEARNKTTVI